MRSSGILLPIFSLPGKYGIGCFSKEAYHFIDDLKECKQSRWQILPMGPTSYGDSPYQSFSTFAGNPYFIDLEELIDQGLLTEEECDAADFGSDPTKIDYEKLYENRFPLLYKAYERSHIGEKEEFHTFRGKNEFWLRDYALFMAVKDLFGGVSFLEWPEDIRRRYDYAMEYYQRELYFRVEFYEFLQYEFDRQWTKLKEYANKKGILIIGDIPIYVAADSADVWAHPELFQLDAEGKATSVAGCPPDGFSATGQLWGNPLYNWDYHKSTGFDWWIRRIQKCREFYNIIRIDHFRGLDEYFSIPAEDETAENGHWEKGPGIEFFWRIWDRLGWVDIIAEDLGYITDSVRKLVKDSMQPNMKVLEFAFDSRDSSGPADYLPFNYEKNCVVYTGTHDNETLCQWLLNLPDAEIEQILTYTGREKEIVLEKQNKASGSGTRKSVYSKVKRLSLADEIIRLAHASVAYTCIIPIQDYLHLGEEARINQPSILGGNWIWRMDAQMSEERKSYLLHMTTVYGRTPYGE